MIPIEVWGNNTRRIMRTSPISVHVAKVGGIPPGMIVIQSGWGVSIKLDDTTQEYS